MICTYRSPIISHHCTGRGRSQSGAPAVMDLLGSSIFTLCDKGVKLGVQTAEEEEHDRDGSNQSVGLM